MRKQQTGFTLIEIAIVLVIIGLLLGGVLKGQELIQSARVRNLISQQDGIKAAFFGFQDRYRAYPGDYSAATTNINGATVNGDGNGRIEIAGAGTAVREDIAVWEHLSRAGFINGTYTYAANTTDNPPSNPKNPYGIYLQLVYDHTYGPSGGTPADKHNLKTGGQIPVEIITEVDRKVDDGLPNSGGFQFSTYQGNAAAAPLDGANNCTSGNTVNATWNTTNGNTNCGGASLF